MLNANVVVPLWSVQPSATLPGALLESNEMPKRWIVAMWPSTSTVKEPTDVSDNSPTLRVSEYPVRVGEPPVPTVKQALQNAPAGAD